MANKKESFVKIRINEQRQWEKNTANAGLFAKDSLVVSGFQSH